MLGVFRLVRRAPLFIDEPVLLFVNKLFFNKVNSGHHVTHMTSKRIFLGTFNNDYSLTSLHVTTTQEIDYIELP